MNAPEQHVPRPAPLCDVVTYFSTSADCWREEVEKNSVRID